ncbi:MAG: amino acid-binding protein [Acidimicrobiaceae bacterium]|nr:amino acid-binding protein [Acidimicrobiaceae bacterium]
MARFSLHAVGVDRPGIVAAVTGALASIGANLEDSRMTILGGQFSIMLVLDAPSVADASLLEEALAPASTELDLLIAVRPLVESAHLDAGGEMAVVSVHGADHPGIVSRMAGEVAAAGGNVVDLATRVVGEPEMPGYVMVLTVALAPGSTLESLSERLAQAAAELQVHCAVAPGDGELL